MHIIWISLVYYLDAPVRACELRLALIQPYHPVEQLGLNLL